MFELLIAVSGATFGAVLAIIAFVAWAVRREDAYLSMAEEAPGPVARSVRRLLGLHVMGLAGPARPAYHPRRRGSRADQPTYRIDPPDDWPPDQARPRRHDTLPAGQRH